MAPLRYNQVRQKGSHNSYRREEGYPDQVLYWRIRSLEIDIHNSNHGAGWPPLQGDWYVYHVSVRQQDSSVNRLSDALDVLASIHRAVPQHEVITIWLDIKDSFSTLHDQTPQALDDVLARKLGRERIWGPPDLIGDAASLQEAISQRGWPSLESLRGKFIVACTTGDLSSPRSHLNQYVDQGSTAGQRLAFVAPEISEETQIKAHDFAVFFNLNEGHAPLARQVLEQGFVSRAYGLDSREAWCNAWKSRAHHLVTNKVNAFQDVWARTDVPATGYPFDSLDGDAGASGAQPGELYAIRVRSGDIWAQNDSCFFQYDDRADTPARDIGAFVSGPRSHVDGWIKAGLMARAGVEADAPYVAVLRTGSHGIRLQCRTTPGGTTTRIDAVVPNGGNGLPLVSENTPIWLRLSIGSDGNSATASYSIDGTQWHSVGRGRADSRLGLQGWAASSHGAGEVRWLFGGMTAPGEGIAIGEDAAGNLIVSTDDPASLGPQPPGARCR